MARHRRTNEDGTSRGAVGVRPAVLLPATVVLFVVIAFIPIPWHALGLVGYVGVFAGTVWGGLGAFAPSPAMGLVISAGRVLNPFVVGILAGAGFAIGEIILFGVVRRMPDSAIPRWIYPVRVERTIARLESTFLWWPLVYVIAVIPTPLFDMVTIWSARARMPVWKYFLPIAAGRATRSLILAFLGTTAKYGAIRELLLSLMPGR